MLVYLFIAVLLAWILAPEGHGSPHYLLGSWGYATFWAVMWGLSRVFPNLNAQWLIILVALSTFALYLFGLMKLNNLLSRVIRFPIPVIPIAIHLGGFYLCLMISGDYVPGLPVIRFWVLTAVFIFIYFLFEWQLALKSRSIGK